MRFPKRRLTLLVLVVGFTAVLVVNLLIYPMVHRHFMNKAVVTSQATLQLAATGVNTALSRFEPLPTLIAERSILLDILQEPDNAGLLPFANQQLRQTARTIGADQAYLLDNQGQVLISSNYRDDESFVAKDFSSQGSFQDAIAGRQGTFHSVDESSGKRYVQFASPVLDGVIVAGVLAVRIDVSELELNWRVDGRDIVLLDADGIVFLSSRPDWIMHTMTPLSKTTLQRINEAGQYPVHSLQLLGVTATPLTVEAARVSFSQSDSRDVYLASSVPLAARGWHAVSFTPEAPVVRYSIRTQILWSFSSMAVMLIMLILLQRQQRRSERIQWLQNQQEALEEHVRHRTAELDRSNAALTLEVKERAQTEERLRTMQHELIQAGKLAALGQLSAGVAHEINQPLTAAKHYARNASLMLNQGHIDGAQGNLEHISSLIDRIADLSTNLRSFARRPRQTLGVVPVSSVIDDAMGIMEAEIRRSGVIIKRSSDTPDLQVVGGRLRLQQVLVNLLSNALDASEGLPSACIFVNVISSQEHVDILVQDQGAGLSSTAIDQVFEPFFTTKDPGKGLGLGLSISFNIIEDFGGTLVARNRTEGGAEFRIRLVRQP